MGHKARFSSQNLSYDIRETIANDISKGQQKGKKKTKHCRM